MGFKRLVWPRMFVMRPLKPLANTGFDCEFHGEPAKIRRTIVPPLSQQHPGIFQSFARKRSQIGSGQRWWSWSCDWRSSGA